MSEVLTSLGFPCSYSLERVWNSLGFDGQKTPSTRDSPSYEEWRALSLRKLLEVVGVPADLTDEVLLTILENDKSWTVRATPGASDLLFTLMEFGIGHCICSNWDYEIAPYLNQARLPPIPSVTSAEVGARKPDLAIVGAALDLLGTEASRSVWFVGDTWEVDVVAALRLGLQPILVGPTNPAPSHVPNFVSLLEVDALVRRCVRMSAK